MSLSVLVYGVCYFPCYGQTETFENEEGYTEGTINGQFGWSGSGTIVSSDAAYAGARALTVDGTGSALAQEFPGKGILYADLWINTSIEWTCPDDGWRFLDYSLFCQFLDVGQGLG